MESFSKNILQKLSEDLLHVDLTLIERSFASIDAIPDRTDKYKQLASVCRDNGILHPDWLHLAGRVTVHLLKDDTHNTFSKSVFQLSYLLEEHYLEFVKNNADELDAMVVESRDWKLSIFGIETLLKSYLARVNVDGIKKVVETPQYLYMRVATFLWYPNMNKIKETYDELSSGYYTHASPTMFNAGLKKPQCASCFLTTIPDNMDGIAKGWKDIAIMSKHSGGWGIDVTQLRHSEIGQYGDSKGLIGWIQIIDKILSIVDQGGKRKGSGTFWCHAFHLDFEEFIDLKKITGSDAMRARDSFYGVVLPDLFMERVKNNEEWTLFCPNKASGLADTWGLEFEMLYTSYEKDAKAGRIKTFRVVKAMDIWKKIISSQIETGGPFILYKDAANRKSNQQNIGTIRQSNLCCEILLATGKVKRPQNMKLAAEIPNDLLLMFDKHSLSKEAQLEIADYLEKDNALKDTYESIASCNLASVALNSCVKTDPENNLYYDFEFLEDLTGRLVENLNQVVDRNFYPKIVPEIRECNLANRALGIGVQGLADTFALLDLEWDSEEAFKLNNQIFETMYYAAVKKSVDLAELQGAYSNFEGSPSSKGLFQFDLWDHEKYVNEYRKKMNRNSPEISLDWVTKYQHNVSDSIEVKNNRYDWNSLRERMIKYGLRNSTLMAVMPTASSANILGNNECIEPYTMHLYSRTVLSGQFVMLNKHLVHDLIEIDMWKTEIVRDLVKNKGSISSVILSENHEHYDRFEFLKRKYKTVFELPQKILLKMMLERHRYIDQTQSFNCWMEKPSFPKINAFHFAGWMGGAKTGMYYLRQTAVSDPINFSIDTINIPENKGKRQFVCVGENGCIGCEA